MITTMLNGSWKCNNYGSGVGILFKHGTNRLLLLGSHLHVNVVARLGPLFSIHYSQCKIISDIWMPVRFHSIQ